MDLVTTKVGALAQDLPITPSANPLLHLPCLLPTIAMSNKFIGGFCGALSGFGAFSEDVVKTWHNNNTDGAFANWAVNAFVALSFHCLLLYVFDGELG